MEKKEFTAISLFSGAMGLDLGLERTGRFRVLACVEKEQALPIQSGGIVIEAGSTIQTCRW